MTIKFTKTGIGNEENNETLLFEFLNHELSEKIELKDKIQKQVNVFVGSLQTSQITGVLIEPISFNGKFFGDYVDNQSRIIRAKERFDQLQNLNGRPVKFWIDDFKIIVLFSKVKLIAEDLNNCAFEITLQPHDIIRPPVPTLVKPIVDNAVNLYNRVTDASNIEVKVKDENQVRGLLYFNLKDNGSTNPNNEDPEARKRRVKLNYHKALEEERIAKEKAKKENSTIYKLNLTDQQISNNLSEASTKAKKAFLKLFGGE